MFHFERFWPLKGSEGVGYGWQGRKLTTATALPTKPITGTKPTKEALTPLNSY